MKDIFSDGKDIVFNLVKNNQEIGIILGQKQDLDRMASALSLYLALKSINKDVQIVSKTEPIIALSNLVGVDKIRKNFQGNIKTLVVSIPYKEGEIEKVSYNTDEKFLNINLFATETGIGSFDEKDIVFSKKGASPSVVFTIGVENPEEISSFVDANSNINVINIDNGISNTMYGDVVLVDPSFSSTSEIVAKIIEELNLPVDIDIAQNLMDGLSFATHNFSSVTTSMYAFDSAGFLLKNGARRKVKEVQNQRPIIRKPFEKQRNFQNPQQKNEAGKSNTDENVPSDWLAPKVFRSKGQD